MSGNKLDSETEWIVHSIVVAKYPKAPSRSKFKPNKSSPDRSQPEIPDDPVGIFFAYFSLLVYEIQAVYITLFLWNRDMLTFYCCFSHMLSEIMNIMLKQLLKQPRPENGAPKGGLFEGRYGMPSQHCHCFAYLISTALLLTFHYYRRHIRFDKKLLVLILSAAGLLLQIVGRIYLRFHTLGQCLVGVAFGSLSAITFYSVGLKYFLAHSESLCRLWPLRWFAFRKDLLTPPPRLKKS